MTDKDEKCDEKAGNVFVARQPVFDTTGEVWGYELLFRTSQSASDAAIPEGKFATSQVLIDGLTMVNQCVGHKVKKLINFDADSLVSGLGWGLPENSVIEILENVYPSAEVLKECRRLSKYYELALDDYVGDSNFNDLLPYSSIVKVDVLALNRQEITAIASRLHTRNLTLLAEKVEDRDMYDFVRGLGFTLFQGFYFSRPKTLGMKKLSSSQIARLQILKAIEEEEDIDPLVRIVQNDVAITYRLLNYINSVGFGLVQEISSVRHAMRLLGQRYVKSWLSALLLADIANHGEKHEIAHMSVVRGFFLASLADEIPTSLPLDSLFLIGLFSLLDALLEQPMDQILDRLHLQSDMAAPLLGRGSPVVPSLDIARACELGNWLEVKDRAGSIGVPASHIATAYNDSLMRAQFLLNDA
ncbi:MAG: EAL and HDOD domain-containing protein [Thermodesulfobacteriota bacterium]